MFFRSPFALRDHVVGGVAPGKCPVPSPRQPTGRDGLGEKSGDPRGALSFPFANARMRLKQSIFIGVRVRAGLLQDRKMKT
jgi:hypothetical protein